MQGEKEEKSFLAVFYTLCTCLRKTEFMREGDRLRQSNYAGSHRVTGAK